MYNSVLIRETERLIARLERQAVEVLRRKQRVEAMLAEFKEDVIGPEKVNGHVAAVTNEPPKRKRRFKLSPLARAHIDAMSEGRIRKAQVRVTAVHEWLKAQGGEMTVRQLHFGMPAHLRVANVRSLKAWLKSTASKSFEVNPATGKWRISSL